MRFFDEGMLTGLSLEDMDLLRKELRALDRQVRTELESRYRNCSYCGERTGAALRGAKYCSAWHRYLDAQQSSAPLSRLEFELKRALRRIRSLRQGAKGKAGGSPNSGAGRTAALRTSLRNIRIRQVLNDYRAITGEGLRQSLRAHRELGKAGA
jgi:hypothetical protein